MNTHTHNILHASSQNNLYNNLDFQCMSKQKLRKGYYCVCVCTYAYEKKNLKRDCNNAAWRKL